MARKRWTSEPWKYEGTISKEEQKENNEFWESSRDLRDQIERADSNNFSNYWKQTNKCPICQKESILKNHFHF